MSGIVSEVNFRQETDVMSSQDHMGASTIQETNLRLKRSEKQERKKKGGDEERTDLRHSKVDQ